MKPTSRPSRPHILGRCSGGLLLACLGCVSSNAVRPEAFTAADPGQSQAQTVAKPVTPQPVAVEQVAYQPNATDGWASDPPTTPQGLAVGATDSAGSSARVEEVESIFLGPTDAPTPPLNVSPPSGNDLASIEAMALAAHPAVLEQRARVQAARGNWLQVGLPFNPVAQYQAEEIGSEGASGLHSIQFSQTWVTANKLGLARGVAAAEVRQEQAQLERVELQVLTAVRTAFISALIAQERVEQTERLLEIAHQSLDSVQAMLEAAEVSRIALLQAQTAADQAQLAYENARAADAAIRRRLGAAVGNNAEFTERLAGDVETLLPEMPWESLVAELIATSPETAAARAELERAQRALRLACAQVTPNVTTWGGAGFASASDNVFATAGVSVPLPIHNRNQGNIAQARAQITAANAALQRTQLDLSGRLAAAVQRYHVARNRVETLQRTVLPRAEETLELSRRAFEAGEASFLELLTVQRTLSQTRLDVLDAIEQARTAAAEIDGLLVNSANLPNP